MTDRLKRISQVGLVVNNREEAIAGFEKYLGCDGDAGQKRAHSGTDGSDAGRRHQAVDPCEDGGYSGWYGLYVYGCPGDHGRHDRNVQRTERVKVFTG